MSDFKFKLEVIHIGFMAISLFFMFHFKMEANGGRKFQRIPEYSNIYTLFEIAIYHLSTRIVDIK